MLANHESGNVLERKIRHLRGMNLFREWSTSDITFFAYSLQQRKLKDVSGRRIYSTTQGTCAALHSHELQRGCCPERDAV